MSTIAFDCEWCGRGYEVPASQAGTKHFCKNCKGETVVPDAATAETVIEPPPAPPSPARGGSPYEPGSPIWAMTGGDPGGPPGLAPPPDDSPTLAVPRPDDDRLEPEVYGSIEPEPAAVYGGQGKGETDAPNRVAVVTQAANLALACGLGAFFFSCPPIGPLALMFGLKARRLAEEHDVELPGTAKVGLLLGGFFTFVLVVGVLFLLLAVVLAILGG